MSTRTFISALKRLRPKEHTDPVRDWLVLIISSLIVLSGIIVWNVWAFETVVSGGTIGGAKPQNTSVFNPASLDEVHAVFDQRAKEEAKYVTGVYRYADPSQ